MSPRRWERAVRRRRGACAELQAAELSLHAARVEAGGCDSFLPLHLHSPWVRGAAQTVTISSVPCGVG